MLTRSASLLESDGQGIGLQLSGLRVMLRSTILFRDPLVDIHIYAAADSTMDQPRSNFVDLEDKPCPLCGSTSSASYLRTPDQMGTVPGEFHIVRCLDCRHLYMNPRPTPATVLNCYAADYGPHQVNRPQSTVTQSNPSPDTQPASTTSGNQPWYLSPAARRIPGLRALYYWLTNDYSNFIPAELGSGRHAVELGCATGTFLARLRSIGCDVEGIEPIAAAALEAQSRGLRVHAGTLASAGLAHGSCDAFFAWMVVEHLLNPKETLQEIQNLLRPDGWLVFSVPNAGCWEPYFFGRSWFAYELPRHLQHFTVQRLRRFLEDCGYERITIIHQRNLLNVVSSVGIIVTRWFPQSRWAHKVLAWSDRPTLWCQLALAPWAIALSWLHQGGRLTVVARKRAATK
jgi:2-polyprenyl-3-methyl-5-hydroxy-6-metoxy-1,4-benzoquinol methylase